MKITCPSCNTSFIVKLDAIPDGGRKVKCANCQHIWHQMPTHSESEKSANISPEPEKVEPIPQGSALPVIIYSPLAKILRISAAVLFVTFLGVLSITNQKISSLFGIKKTEEIVLYDVARQIEEKDLIISGVIANESKEDKHIPILRISVYDEINKKITSIELDSGGAIIQAGKEIQFKNKIPDIPKSANTVIMDLGNSLELAKR